MATPRAPGDDQPVRVIGRYELVSVISPGALGELWKARISSGPEHGRIVAIRRVPRTGSLDPKAVERLTNAGFAAMEVRHPKVAAVLDVVVADSEIALVSEHIGGALLSNLLRPPNGKRPNVSPDVGLRIILDVLEAVDAVRAQWRDLFPSIESEDDRLLAAAVHGGLVPDSVLVASFGEAMLLDAGLAGIAMTMHPILDHADVIAYRAPEQIEPGGPVDERADVFTVAVLLWELLAGRPLFAPAMLPRPAATGPAAKTKAFSDAMQVSTVRRKVLSTSVQRLDALPLLKGRVTKALADIVERCLERDPARRFQSVRELISEIAELGPKAVAGYDAVSRLLASIGAAAPIDETFVEPGSGRSTSNRPTVPPEKAGVRDSDPPDTRRAIVTAEVKRLAAGSSGRSTLETLPDLSGQSSIAESSSEALSASDFQSIPPDANGESSIPPATDVESLPPSTDGHIMTVGSMRSEVASLDVENVPPSPSLQTEKNSTAESPSFASALAPPRGAALARTEETTSAPVVRALGIENGPDLASESTSSSSSLAKNRKIVIGVVAAAGVLAFVGFLRVALSGHSGQAEQPSVSAASSATSSPPTEPSVASDVPAPPVASAAEEAQPPPEEAREPVPQSPTSGPPRSPVGATQPAPPLKRQQPPKKKPFRPSAI